MPNWTTNTVSFTGPVDQVRAIQQLVRSDDETFDFNRICPMPPVLDRVISPIRLGDNGRPILHAVKADGTVDHDAAAVEATPEEAAACATPDGRYTDWYAWSTANWGTKWNACHADDPEELAVSEQPPVMSLTYRFDTAWDAPRQLIDVLDEKLDEIAPDVAVEWEAIHEDGEQHETIFVKGA